MNKRNLGWKNFLKWKFYVELTPGYTTIFDPLCILIKFIFFNTLIRIVYISSNLSYFVQIFRYISSSYCLFWCIQFDDNGFLFHIHMSTHMKWTQISSMKSMIFIFNQSLHFSNKTTSSHLFWISRTIDSALDRMFGLSTFLDWNSCTIINELLDLN